MQHNMGIKLNILETVSFAFGFTFLKLFSCLKSASAHVTVIAGTIYLMMTVLQIHGIGPVFASVTILFFYVLLFLVVQDLTMNLMRVALFGDDYAMPVFSSPKFYDAAARKGVSQFYWKFVGNSLLLGLANAFLWGVYLGGSYLIAPASPVLAIVFQVIALWFCIVFSVRMALALPAISARAKAGRIKDVIALSQGQSWRIFWGLLLWTLVWSVLLVLGLMLAGVNNLETFLLLVAKENTGVLVFAIVFQLLILFSYIGFITNIYRQLVPELTDGFVEDKKALEMPG